MSQRETLTLAQDFPEACLVRLESPTAGPGLGLSRSLSCFASPPQAAPPFRPKETIWRPCVWPYRTLLTCPQRLLPGHGGRRTVTRVQPACWDAPGSDTWRRNVLGLSLGITIFLDPPSHSPPSPPFPVLCTELFPLLLPVAFISQQVRCARPALLSPLS